MASGSRRSIGSLRRVLPVALALAAVLAPVEASAAPPSNDNFADRTVVSALPFTDLNKSTLEATTEPNEPQASCGDNNGKSVWYQYTPAVAETIEATTKDSSFDTVVAVWTGTGLADLSQVACHDDFGDALHSLAVFRATAGTPYFIQVSGWDGEGGDLVFGLRRAVSGSISGTVTSEAGQPLVDICVDVYDAAGYFVNGGVTGPGGTYAVGGLQEGTHHVEFLDLCDDDAQLAGEWFDDRDSRQNATPVTVTASLMTEDVDAALSPLTLTVTKTGSGSGTVTSDPPGISCGQDCAEAYPYGEVVTLTASPEAYSRFAGWSGCDQYTGAECTVTLGDSRSVQARFDSQNEPPAGPAMALQRPRAGVYLNDQRVMEGGPAIVAVGPLTVEVSAADARSGVASFRFDVDGTPVDPSQVTVRGGVYSFTFRPPGPGEYMISARATNGVGATSSLAITVQAIPAG